MLEKGRLESIPQEKGDGVYISKQKMLDMMKVDLDNLENEDLDLKIRAFWFPPYSGAGFEVNGKFLAPHSGNFFKIAILYPAVPRQSGNIAG